MPKNPIFEKKRAFKWKCTGDSLLSGLLEMSQQESEYHLDIKDDF